MRAYARLEDLGFLTPDGCRAVREVCGDDYESLDLIADCWSRGRLWFPTMVLGVLPDATTDRIWEGLREKLRLMAS